MNLNGEEGEEEVRERMHFSESSSDMLDKKNVEYFSKVQQSTYLDH